MVRIALLLAAVAIPWSAPAQPAPARVRVAAAADLKFALDELVAKFSARHPQIRVEPTYGSSGNMHAQLQQRAPFDLFLSADIAYPRDLVSRGLGTQRDLFAYARGRLAVWVPRVSPLQVERDGLRALSAAKRIAIANPRHAPYGRAAEAALRGAGLWATVRNRLILGENVAQAAQFVESGGADAAIIAKSVAVASPMRAAGRSWDIPATMHPPIDQGGLILPWASSRQAANEFRQYLASAEGRSILAAFGFEPPGP
jgi:molybdate transport system substrate-binding protein